MVLFNRKKYNNENLDIAVDKYLNTNISSYKLAEEYNINRTTIFARIKKNMLNDLSNSENVEKNEQKELKKKEKEQKKLEKEQKKSEKKQKKKEISIKLIGSTNKQQGGNINNENIEISNISDKYSSIEPISEKQGDRIRYAFFDKEKNKYRGIHLNNNEYNEYHKNGYEIITIEELNKINEKKKNDDMKKYKNLINEQI